MSFNPEALRDILELGGSMDGMGEDPDPFSDSWDEQAFIRQVNPAVHFATPEEVRKEAEARRKNISANFETLSNIVVRHEATLYKRWTKKTRQNRQKILLSAWPGMATTHRPDFDAFRRASRADSGDRFRDYYMWPHINQEDLLKTKSLPLLLNSRGHNPPNTFAGADYESMHLGLVTKKLTPHYLNRYIMILHGVDDLHEYGKLLSWDEHPDAFDWMHTRRQFLPGEGLMVLEAQDRLLRFLVECCHQILCDIPVEELTASKFPVQPEPQLKSEKELSGFESLAVMAAEAPYRPPPKLDLGRIESVLAGRVSEAEDRVWALREDPCYFLDELMEVKEHRQETLRDTFGDTHPTLKTVHQETFWARACRTLPTEAFLHLEVFAELHTQAQTLRQLHDKHASAISPKKDLPEEFMAAILKFRHYLLQAVKGVQGQLREGVVASPQWRSYFLREPPPDSTTPIIRVAQKPGVHMSDIEKQLLWILRTLWEDGQDLFFVSLPLLVDELGRLLETEPKAQDLLSARLASAVGDLAVISQCIAQLELYHPWARTFENILVDKQEGIQTEYAKRTQSWAKFLAATHEKHIKQAAKLAGPPGKRFVYPIGKRRTKANVEALRQAEANLDAFWAAVDRVIYANCGTMTDTAYYRVLSQPRTMRRTPKWVEPASSTAKSGREAVLDPELADLYKPLSTIYIGKPAEDKISATSAIPKTKTKPRDASTPAPVAEPAMAREVEGEKQASQVVIGVDSRSLKVFRTLFFNPSVTSSPGEVSWNDFLHALTSAGLFAAEKLYGSVWQFQRLEGDQSRIQFHEPHPRGRIPFTTARRHGRRLNRAYGWSGSTFVPKEK